MDAEGNFWASRYHAANDFHHSSLIGGGPVAFAGEFTVTGGVVTWVSNRSGHYPNPASHLARALHSLRRQGVTIDGITADFADFPIEIEAGKGVSLSVPALK